MDFIKLYKLSKKRSKSHLDYLQFQEFQAKIIFSQYNFQLKEKEVLDLGCGNGGYSNILYNLGAKITSADFEKSKFLNKKIKFVKLNGEKLPFKDNSFDFVFCASVIEHVENPDVLLKEISRILKKNGKTYISFPPFYSLNGGHEFKPFHYLPEKLALGIYNFRKKQNIKSYNTAWGSYGLHKRSINSVKKLILKNNFDIISIKTRFFKFPFHKILLIKDFLTWHVEFIIRK